MEFYEDEMKFLESLKVGNPPSGAADYFKNMLGPNSILVPKDKNSVTATNSKINSYASSTKQITNSDLLTKSVEQQ
jgi:hypothetical protein